MSQANCFEICSEELKQLKKSKLTIAEAFDRIESLSLALNRALSLDQKVDSISQTVDSLSAIMQDSLSKGFFGVYVEKLNAEINRKIDIMFEQSMVRFQEQLLAKVDLQYLSEQLKNKVNQNQMDYVKELLQKQQSEFDAFVLTEFHPFRERTRVKIAEHEEIGQKEGAYKHKTDKVIKELMDQVDVIQDRVNDFSPDDGSDDEENVEDFTVEGLLNKMKQQIDENPLEIQSVMPEDMSTIQNAPKRLRLRGVAKKLDKLKGEFINSVKEIANMKQDIELLHKNDAELYSKIEELKNRNEYILQEVEKTNKFRKESQIFKQEVTDTFKENNAQIAKMIEDFKSYETDKLKRIKRLEISQEVLDKSIEKHKKTLNEKLNESIKMLKYLDSQQESQIQQTKDLDTKFSSSTELLTQEISEIKNEIFTIKSPLQTIVAHKQLEIETLNEDLKRNQNVLRGFVEEVMTGLDKPSPSSTYITTCSNFFENKRLKREIIKLRTTSNTPHNNRPRTAASNPTKSVISREESALNSTLPDSISERKKTPRNRRQAFSFVNSLTRTPRNISSRE